MCVRMLTVDSLRKKGVKHWVSDDVGVSKTPLIPVSGVLCGKLWKLYVHIRWDFI